MELLEILINEADIELNEHIVEEILNFPKVLKVKKHLQSFLGVVNFAGIFLKDLAKYALGSAETFSSLTDQAQSFYPKRNIPEMEAFETNSIILRLRHLKKNLEELDKKFEQLMIKAQIAGQLQRADLDTVQIAIMSIMFASLARYGMTSWNQFGRHHPQW
ncbi:hypothetical protein Sango_2664900 [Sesamum angolense]|uniref:Uncharacterized protein n=1 Tax=Sesamum angolense TaxID=2727404 RepID=A0AAE1W2A0_9LAMI|nr:hypothetical protein Sango_2664900 [Sesamum angolense]